MKGKTTLAVPTLLKVKPNNNDEQEIQNRLQENTRRKEGNDSARRVQFLMCCYYCVLLLCVIYMLLLYRTFAKHVLLKSNKIRSTRDLRGCLATVALARRIKLFF